MNPEPLPEDMGALVEGLGELLRQALGPRTALAGYTVGNRLPDYLVLLARLRRLVLDVVIKFAGPGAPYPCPFERTAALHRLVRARTTVPLPEVLAADDRCRTWPWRYMIKLAVPGEEWVTVRPRLGPDELARAYAQLGDAVAQLHALPFPDFGELADDGSLVAGATCLEALRERARRIIAAPRLQDLFLAALEERAGLFAEGGRPGLVHEDLHCHNILFARGVGGWRLATILDFDKAWAGPPESDLARLELWRGMMGEGFWPAYRAGYPLDPLYPDRRPLYQLLWCLEFARPTPQHLADTRAVCAELGMVAVRFDE